MPSRAASRSWSTPPPSISSGRARGSQRGADLVVYSGGKFLRGPQTSGLLLGNKRLCQAAWRNGSPHQALGRPMKVSKEDIIGVVTALEYWFGERDDAAERRKWYDDCAASPSGSAQLDGVRGEVIEPSGVDRVPRLKVVWDGTRYPLDGLGCATRCSTASRGSCSTTIRRPTNSIAIDPFQLQPGEAAQVGDAIVAALRASLTNRSPATRAPAPRIAGEWELRVEFMHGARIHRLALEQRAATSPATSARRSSRAGQRRDRRRPDPLLVRRPLRGEHISYRFEGRGPRRRDGRHRDARRRQRPEQGIVNRSQFGAGAWEARRVA